jgi:excisionase family DNA binding protein
MELEKLIQSIFDKVIKDNIPIIVAELAKHKNDAPIWYTTAKLASLLEMDEATIRRWCKTGKMPATKYGKEYRITPRDLDNYEKRNRLS